MIPAIALMIAIYGSARLINDGLKKHVGKVPTALTWIVGALAIAGLWILAIAINHSAANVPQFSQ
jgi:hypothetical protein